MQTCSNSLPSQVVSISSRFTGKRVAINQKMRLLVVAGFFCGLWVACKGDTRLGDRVMVLLVCQWMTIYDIHDTFMVVSIMYYTRSKNQHSQCKTLQ